MKERARQSVHPPFCGFFLILSSKFSPSITLEWTQIPFFENFEIFFKISVCANFPTLQVPVAAIEKKETWDTFCSQLCLVGLLD